MQSSKMAANKGILYSQLGCVPCLFKQALNTVRIVTHDKETQLDVLKRLAKLLQEIDLERTPAALSNLAYQAVREITGVEDPYKEEKVRLNNFALNFYDLIKQKIEASDEPLLTAAIAAIAGNVIDLGIGTGHTMDFEKELETIFRRELAINHFDRFAKDLESAKRICCFLDNCGEIVFDKIFMEELLAFKALEITAVVKSGPIINDATTEDARQTGLADVVKVIGTGSNRIGCDPEYFSEETRAAFKNADIVISKGQGNLESLTAYDENIYFLLKAKCEIVAEFLGVNLGDWIFLANKRRK